MSEWIKKIVQYITKDIWVKKEHEYKSRRTRWAVRQFKVFIFTAQGIGQHSILVRSAALTFYTLMSLVPIAALVFSVMKGFGFEARLNEYLHEQFPQYRVLIDQVLTFANAMIQRTKGGVIASVGVVVLFWSVIKVFNYVESSFNSIWEVRRSRSLTRKFSDYTTVIVIAPILWVISSSIGIQIQQHLLHYTSTPIVNVLLGTLSTLVIWTMFTFVYLVMPNTKVKLRSALTAGIMAGTIFVLFQLAYVFIQSRLTNYNAIYGSFAAVPLFLIWLQTSWQIVLFGAELSFAYQNIRKFEFEKTAEEMSLEYRKKALLVIMHQIVKHFMAGGSAMSSEEIARNLNLPVRVVRDTVFALEKAGLIVPVVSPDEKTGLYVPARDIHTIRVYDVIHRVETSGHARAESRVRDHGRHRAGAEPGGKRQSGQPPDHGYRNRRKKRGAGMKTVVVIGSGNVAEALAGAIAASPYGLAQLYARNRDRGERIARSYGCPFASDPQELAPADIHLIAVSDRAVGEVAEALDFGRAVVAHTAGSVPLDGLPGKIRNRGVFYPLQTFTAGRHISLGDVPLLVEGSDPQTTRTLLRLARALSSNARQASSEERAKLHLAAVFASNFSNHMYAIAQQLLDRYGLPADLLKPLMRETAAKALESASAADVQTGPARRGDMLTQKRHLDMLDDCPELQSIYENISRHIWEISKKT